MKRFWFGLFLLVALSGCEEIPRHSGRQCSSLQNRKQEKIYN